MDFSQEDNQEIDLVEEHLEKVEAEGVKKYVVSIENRFVPLIDEMSIDERNEVINDIIALHNDEVNSKKQTKKALKYTIATILLFITLLFAAPGLLWLINQSFTMTQNNYSEMQNNFEVLYKNKKK